MKLFKLVRLLSSICIGAVLAIFSTLPQTIHGGFSLVCEFECVDLPYRPVCAKNMKGDLRLLPHKCFFKELMCREPRAYWRFTKKRCTPYNPVKNPYYPCNIRNYIKF